MVSATHMLGHYTSTRYVLSKAGIPNILPTIPRATDITYDLIFADDARLRFSATPAGTHGLSVCYEAAKRLSKYQYAYYCSGLTDFNVLPRWRSVNLENPAKYHVGSLYLTGEKDTSFQDTACDYYVGRLGTISVSILISLE
jgi:hypothetical protein